MNVPSFVSLVAGLLTVAAVLSFIALAVSLVTRRRRPALEHACWLVVLLRLVTPPMLPLAIPGLSGPYFFNSTTTKDGAASRNSAQSSDTADDVQQDSDSIRIDIERRVVVDDSQSKLASLESSALKPVGVDQPTAELRRVPVKPFEPSLDSTQNNSTDGSLSKSQNRTATVLIPVGTGKSDDVQDGRHLRPFTNMLSSILPLAMIVWLAGSLLAALRCMLSQRKLNSLFALSEPPASELASQLAILETSMQIRSRLNWRIIAAAVPPLVVSKIGTPTVVVPKKLVSELDEESLALLITHELAHVRRGDHLVRWIELVAGIMWWWCPLFWVARRQLRVAEEAACDAWVLNQFPERATQYARAIVRTIELIGRPESVPQLATSGLGALRDIDQRLRAIHGGRSHSRVGSAATALVVLLAALSCPLMLIGHDQPSVADTKIAESNNISLNEKENPTVVQSGVEIEKSENSSGIADTSDDQKFIQSVLAANRLWQSPPLENIYSIEFTHRMSPDNYDERFRWRKDGTVSIEVTNSVRKDQRNPTGWLTIRPADGSHYLQNSTDSLPRFFRADEITNQNLSRRKTPLSAQELHRRETLRWLSGTRLNFAAIDWGRRPDDFVVQSVKRNDDSTSTIELKSTSDAGRDSEINAGAMFHTVSWAYKYGVSIRSSRLIVDADLRIVREESDLGEGRTATIALTEWVSGAGGLSAPGRIEIKVPKVGRFDEELTVDQRFQVASGKLWILTSGVSKFVNNDSVNEEIVDLAINPGSTALDGQLAGAQINREKLENPVQAEAGRIINLRGLTPLELGAVHSLDQSPSLEQTGLPADVALKPTSIAFVPDGSSPSFREMWSKMDLVAELKFPAAINLSKSGNERLFLALYDEHKQPSMVLNIPESALIPVAPTAAEVLAKTWESNKLWLSPINRWGFVYLEFRHQEFVKKLQLSGDSRETMRGITMECGVDSIGDSPSKWKVPVAFRADWKGRAVNVYGITGPVFGQVFGNGIEGTYFGGYSVSRPNSILLITDAVTGQPLLEQSEGMQFEFHEYIEPKPGQYVPLRIIARSSSFQLDFRFQLLHDELWLFDRSAHRQPSNIAAITDVLFNGLKPNSVRRSSSTDIADELKWFNWSEVTNRQVLREGDALSAQVASIETPASHPYWKEVTRLKREEQPDGSIKLRVSLSNWPPMRPAKFWTLSRVAGTEAQAFLCSETLPLAEATQLIAIPATSDQAHVVPLPPNWREENRKKNDRNGNPDVRGTRVSRITAANSSTGELKIQPTIISTNWQTEQSVLFNTVVVNSDGIAVNGGSSHFDFRTFETPIELRDVSVTLQEDEPQSGIHMLLGLQSEIIGGPLRSRWGRFFVDDTWLVPANLLPSRFPLVREVGLRDLLVQSRREVGISLERNEKVNARKINDLVPHVPMLQRVLSGQHGDSDEAIAIACRLAGYSQDQMFVNSLRPLLNHSSPLVQDCAAIGLGLLGNAEGQSRLESLRAAESAEKITHRDNANVSHLFQEAQWALNRIGATP